MFFTSTSLGRCLKTLTTILLRISLVRTIPHAKYTRVLYPYIPGGSYYSDLYGVPKGNIADLSQYQIISFLRVGFKTVYYRTFSDSVQHMNNIGIKQSLRKSAHFEQIFLKNIKKLYQHNVKCDNNKIQRYY